MYVLDIRLQRLPADADLGDLVCRVRETLQARNREPVNVTPSPGRPMPVLMLYEPDREALITAYDIGPAETQDGQLGTAVTVLERTEGLTS